MAKGAYDGSGGFDSGGATGPSRSGGTDKPSQSQIDAYTQAASSLNAGGFTLGGNNTNTGQSAASGAEDYSRALNDYNNVDNSFLENLGNLAAGMFGFNEQTPSVGSGPNAGWGFDPAVGVGNLAGMAFGVPGLGMAANVASEAFNRPAEIDLGGNVFDGFGPTPSGSNVSGMGAGGGGYGGGGNASYGGPDGGNGGISGITQPAPSQTNGYAPPTQATTPTPNQQAQTPDGMYYRPQGLLDQAPTGDPQYKGLLDEYYAQQAWNPSWFSGPFSVPGASSL
ncbi:hypothetical protein [Kiloniella antarctica]|uniref:Uncharacterized protein n=1 Tax=Kiloniella antarctica TaxID=1550907 RepID=A0ABW5BM17_9PROT